MFRHAERDDYCKKGEFRDHETLASLALRDRSVRGLGGGSRCFALCRGRVGIRGLDEFRADRGRLWRAPGETGLHFKAPWQVALKIDRRLKVFEPPPREVITGDKRNLEIAAFVVWQVADPVLFLRAAGGPEMAEARLYERVAAGLSDAVGRRDLEALAFDRTGPLGARRSDSGSDGRCSRIGTQRAGRPCERCPAAAVQSSDRGPARGVRSDSQ